MIDDSLLYSDEYWDNIRKKKEAAREVIEISYKCPIMDCVWKSPITDETVKGVRFFCWANSVYWYSDCKENFFEFIGREKAVEKGCKHVVMDNLS